MNLQPFDIGKIDQRDGCAGGQRFLHGEAGKIAEACTLLAGTIGRREVHVDGGVNRDTAMIPGGLGAGVLVVGSALFQRGHDTAREVGLVRALAEEGRRLAAAGLPIDDASERRIIAAHDRATAL